MDDVLLVFATWFHLIAIVVWFVLIIYSAIFFFPSVSTVAPLAKAQYLVDYRRKAIVITLAAVVVFGITGFALVSMNENDQGIGNVFANSWTTQIFAKHLVILIMIILEIWVLFISLPKLINVVRQLADNKEPPNTVIVTRQLGRLIKQNQISSIALSILGLVVLFLVAALP